MPDMPCRPGDTQLTSLPTRWRYTCYEPSIQLGGLIIQVTCLRRQFLGIGASPSGMRSTAPIPCGISSRGGSRKEGDEGCEDPVSTIGVMPQRPCGPGGTQVTRLQFNERQVTSLQSNWVHHSGYAPEKTVPGNWSLLFRFEAYGSTSLWDDPGDTQVTSLPTRWRYTGYEHAIQLEGLVIQVTSLIGEPLEIRAFPPEMGPIPGGNALIPGSLRSGDERAQQS